MTEKAIIDNFSQWLQTRVEVSGSRQLLVLSEAENDKASTQDHAKGVYEECPAIKLALQLIMRFYPTTLYVGRAPITMQNDSCERIEPKQLIQYLGAQYSAVLIDCREGWQPNHLYAAAGLVEQSGLLVFITPALSTWSEHFAQNTVLPFSYGDKPTQSYFSAYLLQHFINNASVAWLSQTRSQLPTFNASSTNSIAAKHDTNNCLSTMSSPIELSEAQNEILQQIIVSWQEQSHSCHFITGARGRGKTTLLAKLCSLAAQNQSCQLFAQIAICAASTLQRNIVMQCIQTFGETQLSMLSIAPDGFEQICPNTLLVIDEAASIAPELLSKLLGRSDHSLISATTQGYEGSGKGLIYRWLPNVAKDIKHHRLLIPFRWTANDALEPLIDDIFAPSPPKPLSVKKEKRYDLVLVTPQVFTQHMEFLKACIGLLQDAHYQSSPVDILRMLDSSDHHIWAYTDADNPFNPENLLGVICTIIEGGNTLFFDRKLCQDISLGKRRVQGHMSVQAIAMGLNLEAVLGFKTSRIHRIAVTPTLQRKNIGTSMLKRLLEQREALSVDGFSSSFGMTNALVKFWNKNDYLLVKVGHRIDTSSGAITGHFVHKKHPLYTQIASESASQLNLDRQYFASYQSHLMRTALKSTALDKKPLINEEVSKTFAYKKLNLFVEGILSYAMTRPAVYYAVQQSGDGYFKNTFDKLHEKHLSRDEKLHLIMQLKTHLRLFLHHKKEP